MSSPSSIALEKGLPANSTPRGSSSAPSCSTIPFSSRLPAPCRQAISASKNISASIAAWPNSTSAARRSTAITLANELLRYNELESVDGLSYLVSLDDGLPKIPNLDGYVQIIRDKAVPAPDDRRRAADHEPRADGRGHARANSRRRRRDAAETGRIARHAPA